MIPVSLVIKGLYSYQGTQRIEFDRLIEGQLFGIFGPVGSGKSSILEAISFALYGDTERLNQRENRNYNMMNLKSDELLIDFHFRNFDGNEYRFTVRGRRNSKDFSKVNTFDRAAYQLVEGEWIPLESASAEGVLGLSYENFRRTIIIPQGRFQEFLQLGDKDRTKMLKEIFHLDKFEFFEQTVSLQKKNDELLSQLAGQLSHYQDVNSEWIEEKKELVARKKAEVDALNKQLEEKRLHIQAQEKLKGLFDQLQEAESHLERLLGEEEEMSLLEKKLTDYEYCFTHFKNKFEHRARLLEEQRTQAGFLDNQRSALTNSQTALEQLSHEERVVLQEFEKLEQYRIERDDLERVLQLLELRKEGGQLQKRIAEGGLHVEKAQKERAEAASQLEAAKMRRSEMQAKMPDVVQLSSMRSWFEQRKQLLKTQDRYREQVELFRQRLDRLQHSVFSQLQDPLLDGIAQGSWPDYHRRELEERRLEWQERIGNIQKQVEHHQVHIRLGDFVRYLEEGQPCMLCGSDKHPQKLEVADVQSELGHLSRELEQGREAERQLNELQRDLLIYTQQEKDLRAHLEDTTRLLREEAEAAQLHESAFSWEGFDSADSEAVDRLFGLSEQLQRELKALEAQIGQTEQKLQRKSDDYERFLHAVNDFKSKQTALISRSGLLEEQLRRVSLSDFTQTDTSDLSARIEALDENVVRIRKRHEEVGEQRNRLQQEQLILNERIFSATSRLKDYDSKIGVINDDLKSCMASSPYADEAEVNAILKEVLDVQGLKRRIGDYHKELFACRKQYLSLKEQAGEQQFSQEELDQLQKDFLEWKQNCDDCHSDYIREQSALNKAAADLLEKQKLETKQQQLLHRAENIHTLKLLFKGSGFVSYISTVYLQNLCEVANKRFYTLTRQQLRLEVTDKNEFQVRDYLNNGKVRNVKTLSGGQTFQASLSLALALAESIQQQSRSDQNFFFLDEGFGSLDKESLQTAFDTLKSLRQENRVVGIISHVEELQQEIDVFLSVANDPFTGSRIKGNWEQV